MLVSIWKNKQTGELVTVTSKRYSGWGISRYFTFVDSSDNVFDMREEHFKMDYEMVVN